MKNYAVRLLRRDRIEMKKNERDEENCVWCCFMPSNIELNLSSYKSTEY
jgi:hypothetical protein